MTVTALPIINSKDSFDVVSALGLDFVWTAADVANGNSFVSTGHEVVLVNNTGGSSYTVTVTSQPDAYGRSGDLTTYAVAAGLFSVLPHFTTGGWKQSDGTIHLSASNAAVKFAVIHLPR